MEKISKVKALSLVVDWSLWPRHEANSVDSANIRKIKEAYFAGCILPPIVIDAKSRRIVDGVHRHKAVLSVFGDEAEINVIEKDYKNDMEIFIDSIKLNNIHGLPLSPRDQIHCIIMLRERLGKKIPWSDIAPILGMTDERAQKFYEERSATSPEGETVPLPGGALMLAGKTLTKNQEKYRDSSSGILPIVYARMLIRALDAGIFPDNEDEKEICLVMIDKIQAIIGRNEKKRKAA